jgi:hypothetical protein
MKSTLIKDLYGEIERLKAGESLYYFVVDKIRIAVNPLISCHKY